LKASLYWVNEEGKSSQQRPVAKLSHRQIAIFLNSCISDTLRGKASSQPNSFYFAG